MTAVSSKSASLRPSSLYFQRRVPRSSSNPDLPSPSLSPEEELAFAANASLTAASKPAIHPFFQSFLISPMVDTSSNKVIGETAQGIIKDPAYSNKTSQQRKVSDQVFLNGKFYFNR